MIPRAALILIMVDKIEGGHGIELFGNLLEFQVELFMEKESEPGGCAPPLGIALEMGLPFDLRNGIESDGLLGMRDPHDRPKNDRDLEFFRKFKGHGQHLLGFSWRWPGRRPEPLQTWP